MVKTLLVCFACLAASRGDYTKMSDAYPTTYNQGAIGPGTGPITGLTYDQIVDLGKTECDKLSNCISFMVYKNPAGQGLTDTMWWFDSSKGSDLYNTDWDMYYKPTNPCAVNQVMGKWQWQFVVTAPTTIICKHGTTKTNQDSKTTIWSTDVTAHVEEDFKIWGFGGKASVDAEVGRQVASMSSTEWQMNDEEDFEVAFQKSNVGKSVWQFQFAVTDDCESGAKPVTKEYALTNGAWVEPCCIPGYCVDAPSCDICHSAEFMIPGADGSRCQVANSTALPVNGNVFGDMAPATFV